MDGVAKNILSIIDQFQKDKEEVDEIVKNNPASYLARMLQLKHEMDHEHPIDKRIQHTALYAGNYPWFRFLINELAGANQESSLQMNFIGSEEDSNFSAPSDSVELNVQESDKDVSAISANDIGAVSDESERKEVETLPEDNLLLEGDDQYDSNHSDSLHDDDSSHYSEGTEPFAKEPGEEVSEILKNDLRIESDVVESNEGEILSEGNKHSIVIEQGNSYQSNSISAELNAEFSATSEEVEPIIAKESEEEEEEVINIANNDFGAESGEAEREEEILSESNQPLDFSSGEEIPENEIQNTLIDPMAPASSEEEIKENSEIEITMEPLESSLNEMDKDEQMGKVENGLQIPGDAQSRNENIDSPTNPDIAFEPLHTIDYFASQGIKLTEADLSDDKLSRQVKSFTGWLKSMKKLHPGKLPEQDEVVQQIIQSAAEVSNVESDVLTEAMAEVLVKQNRKDKAIEMYQKLSLMNPSKSAYFAAKIESLKIS